MNITYLIGKSISSFVFSVLFRRKVLGRENFPKGAAIIASNHASFLDPPVVGSSAPGELHYLARASLFRFPLMKRLYGRINVLPVRQDAANMSSIKTILGKLDEGGKVLIFPEGTRSFDGKLQKPQRGIGYLICKARVPVIPTYTHGTYEAWPRHRSMIHFTKMIVSFGKPIYFEDVWSRKPSKEDYDRIARKIMDRIVELRSEVLELYGK